MWTRVLLLILFVSEAGSLAYQSEGADSKQAGNPAPSEQSLRQLFERARLLEETNQNLAQAIKLYEEVVSKAREQRALAAKAQLQIGLLYERLGRRAEAQDAFRAVIANFADQTQLVQQARAKIPAAAWAKAVTVRRVFAMPNVTDCGTPSPDGSLLVYIDEKSSVVLRDLATGEDRRLTNGVTDGSVYTYRPLISPDGKQIVYMWGTRFRPSEMRVMNLDGSHVRTLYGQSKFGIEPSSWSPDSRYIAANLPGEDGQFEILLITVATGAVRSLKKQAGSAGSLAFSPDGRYLAYDVPRKEKENRSANDIFVLSLDGLREMPLVQHAAKNSLLGWAPDGKHVLFASDRSGSVGIWSIAVADGKPQGQPELIRPDTGALIALGFARDGTFFYKVNIRMQNAYIAALDPETGKIVSAPEPVATRYVGLNNVPIWTPDGKTLIYAGTGPRSSVLTIRSLETGEERDVKPQLSFFDSRFMAHDGRSIILQGQSKDGLSGFYRTDAATGEATPILQASSTGVPWYLSFSADGKTLYYLNHIAAQSLKQVFKRNMETGAEKEIYRVPDSHRVCMHLSPDGRRLACIHWKRPLGINTLFTMSPDGGESRELLAIKEPEQLAYPGFTWSVDGRYILFGVSRGEQTELWRISAEGGQPQSLGIRMEGIHTLSVHPDGRRIAFGGGSIMTEVWALENYLPKP